MQKGLSLRKLGRSIEKTGGEKTDQEGKERGDSGRTKS